MGFPVAHLGRHPKPKDLVGKLLFGAGSVLRGLGSALDAFGAGIQGPYGLKDERECRDTFQIFRREMKGGGCRDTE